MYQSLVGKLKKPGILLICAFIILGVFFIRSHEAPGSTDAYWHLSIGRQVWQLKQIPSNDLFIYGSVNNKFTPVEWLSDTVMFLFVKFLGVRSIYLLRVIVGLSILFIIYKTLTLFELKESIKVSALFLAGFVMPARFSLDRPENFSLLFLSAVNYCCFYFFLEKKITKAFYVIPLLFLFWPNVHAYVSVGIFLIISWAFIFIFQSLLNKKRADGLFKLLFISVLSAALALIQFRGTLYFLQTPVMSAFDVTEQVSTLERLSEIKTDFLVQVPYEIYLYFFTVVIFIFLCAIYLKRKGLNLTTLMLVALYSSIAALSMLYFRFIVTSVVLIIPFIGYVIKSSDIEPKKMDILNTVFVSFICMLILISVLLGHVVGWRQYWSYTRDYNGNYNGVRNFHWTTQFPLKEPGLIAQNLNTRHLFTSKLWDNYFIWSLPGIQTFSDAIWEFRDKNDFYNEQKLSSESDNWQELIKAYDIDTVVNSQYDSIYDNLTPVYKLPDWKLVYVNANAVIYARNDIIKNLPVDLSKIQAQKAYYPLNLSFDIKDQDQAVKQLQDLVAFDNKNAFARSQLILFYLYNKNDLAAATKLTVESRYLIPQDPIFSFFMAAINVKENKCDVALDFAHEMQQKSYNDANLKQSANAELSKCSVSL